MNKGIVMEMTDKSIIVMRQDGKFEKISRKNRSCEVGEEIIYADARVNWASPSVAGRSAIVAAVVFCLVLFASFAGKIGSSEVVAYVSLDINPSVEMGIDEKEQVLELRGLNEDGSNLIQTVDFKGKTLEDVTASLLDKAEQNSLAKGEADIVIASTVVQETEAVNDVQIAERLRKQVTEHIKQTHPEQVNAYQVEAFAAPQEVRAEANKSGISMGKYSVYLNAKSNGIEVSVDELKNQSVHKIIKANPDNKTAVIAPEKVPTKEAIKKLMQEEKSGELDKRLQEKKKQRAGKDDEKNTNSNNTKTDPKKPASGSDSKSNNSNKEDKNDKDKKDNNEDKDVDRKNDNRKNDDKDDDRKDDKKTSGSATPKPNTTKPVVQPGTTKPGTQDPGAVRPVDNRKDDDKDDNKQDDKKTDTKKDNNSEKDDSKKGDPVRNDDNKRVEDEKKQQDSSKNGNNKTDDNKKSEDVRKEQDTKTDPKKVEPSKEEDSKKESDSKRDSDSRKDADSKKETDSQKEEVSRKD